MKILAFILIPSFVFAHGDEPHAHDAPAHSDTPQSYIGLASEKVTLKTTKATVRLMGSIISDPSGYARLQVTQTARVLNNPDYPIPLPGQAVKIDQAILAVMPTITKIETTVQKNALYKIESDIIQKRKEVSRLERLGQYAARKDLENAQTELESGLKQKEEITQKAFATEILRSPINGFIADIHVRPGEIVTSDKTIVEVIDPSKLLIEAYVFDAKLASQIKSGYVRLPLSPGHIIPLDLIGVSPKVNKDDQAIHIQFKPKTADAALKLDMAVEVIGEMEQTQPILIIPQKAVVVKKNETRVFVRTNPETIEARHIHTGRIFDDTIEVLEGLSIGEDIITDGAYLLNQVS